VTPITKLTIFFLIEAFEDEGEGGAAEALTGEDEG